MSGRCSIGGHAARAPGEKWGKGTQISLACRYAEVETSIKTREQHPMTEAMDAIGYSGVTLGNPGLPLPTPSTHPPGCRDISRS